MSEGSPREDLARMEGVTCRVDSFYSSGNCADAALFNAAPDQAAKAGAMAFALEDLLQPKLRTLREQYKLDEVIAPGKTEIEKMALLRSWVKSRWEHKTPRIFPRWDALQMLELAGKGEKFYCVQSCILLLQCAQAVGWQARKFEVHMERGEDHSIMEIWSRDLKKWVVMDPDFNLHYVRAGVPLGALELHNAWRERKIDDIELVRGPCPYGIGDNKGVDMYHDMYVVWRNDFYGRPDAPVRLVHFVDDDTPGQIVADGALLFLDPRLFGPHSPYPGGEPGYMRPFSLETRVVIDGDEKTAWAADNNGKEHFVEILFPSPRGLSEMKVFWPGAGGDYIAPRDFTILSRQGGKWEPLIKGDLEAQEAKYPLTLPLPPGEFDGIRIECPANPDEKTGGPGFGVAEIEFQAQ